MNLRPNGGPAHGKKERYAPILVFALIEPICKREEDAKNARRKDGRAPDVEQLRLAVEAIPDTGKDRRSYEGRYTTVVKAGTGVEQVPLRTRSA